MESEEAIMENENNSNVESESNIRDYQLLGEESTTSLPTLKNEDIDSMTFPPTSESHSDEDPTEIADLTEHETVTSGNGKKLAVHECISDATVESGSIDPSRSEDIPMSVTISTRSEILDCARVDDGSQRNEHSETEETDQYGSMDVERTGSSDSLTQKSEEYAQRPSEESIDADSSLNGFENSAETVVQCEQSYNTAETALDHRPERDDQIDNPASALEEKQQVDKEDDFQIPILNSERGNTEEQLYEDVDSDYINQKIGSAIGQESIHGEGTNQGKFLEDMADLPLKHIEDNADMVGSDVAETNNSLIVSTPIEGEAEVQSFEKGNSDGDNEDVTLVQTAISGVDAVDVNEKLPTFVKSEAATLEEVTSIHSTSNKADDSTVTVEESVECGTRDMNEQLITSLADSQDGNEISNEKNRLSDKAEDEEPISFFDEENNESQEVVPEKDEAGAQIFESDHVKSVGQPQEEMSSVCLQENINECEDDKIIDTSADDLETVENCANDESEKFTATVGSDTQEAQDITDHETDFHKSASEMSTRKDDTKKSVDATDGIITEESVDATGGIITEESEDATDITITKESVDATDSTRTKEFVDSNDGIITEESVDVTDGSVTGHCEPSSLSSAVTEDSVKESTMESDVGVMSEETSIEPMESADQVTIKGDGKISEQSDVNRISETSDSTTEASKSMNANSDSCATVHQDLLEKNGENSPPVQSLPVSSDALLKEDNSAAAVDSSCSETGVTKTQDAATDEDVEILQIKTEAVSSGVMEISGDEVREEQALDTSGNTEEEVMVIDDEGEVVPVEVEEAKTVENGLGIQISAVSGQQHQLHANAEQNLNSLDAANKTDTAKSKSSKSKVQTCIVCKKTCKCKYNIVRNGDIRHLCDDVCFKQFRKTPGLYLKGKDDTKPSPKDVPTVREALSVSKNQSGTKQSSSYKTCAVCQLMNLNTQQPFCNWKGLDFCGESCLGKFQGNLNTSCSFCHAYIPLDMRATFCLKIGNDMRPFCKQRCYNEFKKKLRLCAFCQRDIAAVPTAFTAMVGTDGKFKEFCSQPCLKKMESQVNDVEVLSVEKGNLKQETITCSVCEKQGAMKHTIIYQHKVNKLCSDLCLSAFQYSNKINMSKCDSCGTICTAEEAQAHFVQFEGQLKRFCSDQCVNQFRKTNSKVVPCAWCATKKLNFDMIERLDAENKYQMFCSLNCLSLYRVNLQAKSNQAIACDQCRKVVPAQYHLTMSDASVRNFCSYTCVVTFQSQFTTKHSPQLLGSTLPSAVTHVNQHDISQACAGAQGTQSKLSGPKSMRARMNTRQASIKAQPPSFPVISNVMSLAPQAGDQALNISIAQTHPVVLPQTSPAMQNSNMVPSGDGKHQILIQAAAPKVGKNKSLQCRPFTQTKATSCRPHSQSKEVQTDEVPVKSVFVPVPVPIYIPMPCAMYTAPSPRLVAFPLPIPVPIFIPTTRKSANGISKTIKEIVERMPSDPLEAELLMMAEAVAADKGNGDSDTDSEGDGGTEDFGVPNEEEMRPIQREDEALIMRKREGQGEEDMIQMALRMAEEMSGPIEDLESSVEPVAVNIDPPRQQQQQHQGLHYDSQVDDDYISRSGRGRGAKRPNRGRPPSSRAKRQRIETSYSEDDSVHSEPVGPPQLLEPPPDVNYRLKFTYGVNAWRHWVINKNAHIDKTKQTTGSFRMRLFPTDILKCTTDELNFTLCMFIKEVRKPNGDEYSPDSIYYLCLGIQQYLYENNRIDNIFTDMYFEKFTDSLHEVLKTHQPKVNNQGQMLCRIEEEHLWESKQLGAHSPFVLLNTLIYFHTKHFILKTAQEHMSLSFAQILKHWKKGMPMKGQSASSGKNVSLRFYCLANGKKDGLAARKSKEGVPVYEVTENFDNPLRCPVKLYEFFLSKCPESIKNRNDIFYPVPERSCVPDSPVWYSTQSIDIHTMDKMLTRVLLVREIQEAHLHAQPIYL